MPSDETTQELVRRFYEATGEEFEDLLEESLATDVVIHDPHLEEIRGRDRVEDYYASFHEAFPDVEFTVDDLFVAGDRFAIRWTAEGTQEAEFWDIEPAGNEIHLSGLDVVRIEDDAISEVWTLYDSATLIQQLGVELPIRLPIGEQ